MKYLKLSRLAVLILVVAVLLLTTTAWALAAGAGWPAFGYDLANTRHAKSENKIDPANASTLTPSWVFQTGGDVSATPAVDGQYLYLPDWAGNFFKLDRDTGAVAWSRTFASYTGVPGNLARATPAIHGNMLLVGDQGGRLFHGAKFMAINKQTGDLIWSTQVDSHPAAIVTQSAVVFDERVYVGIASLEELFAADPNYPCCSFRGSIVALDLHTGQILWRTHTVPDIAGYSGNAVWGGMPTVDPKRGSLYVATGNNYEVPDDVLACVAAADGDPAATSACIAPDNYFDSILALDLETGEVKWDQRALPFDAWTIACLFPDDAPAAANCTSPSGPDLDFGEAPTLFTVRDGQGMPRELLGAGQKSGQYWAVDPDSGEVVWVTKAGPGGLIGGLIWGSAVDGERIYLANANADQIGWTLVGGETVDYGFWSALDPATGEILWQTPNPAGASSMGPVTVANGVVYACSLDVDGHMYALDAATGEILWSFASGGSCNAGAAVAGGAVYWGSGYASLAGLLGATGNDKVYAFTLLDQ